MKRQVLLGRILRYGVFTAMIVVGFGAVLYLLQEGSSLVNYQDFRENAYPIQSFRQMINGLLFAQGSSYIQMGLCILILTPIIRLLLAIYSFAVEKDYLYVVIGLIVLTIILVSLGLGLTH
ncbi:MAG: DUF1634 domain-containing protein [Pedobacter sp.]|nr:MAG: DUF1634 domain-containing protein [Pedobacter sp.]